MKNTDSLPKDFALKVMSRHVFTPLNDFRVVTDTIVKDGQDFSIPFKFLNELQDYVIEFLFENWRSVFNKQLTRDHLRAFTNFEFDGKELVPLHFLNGRYKFLFNMSSVNIKDGKIVPIFELLDYSKSFESEQADMECQTSVVSSESETVNQILEEYSTIDQYLK